MKDKKEEQQTNKKQEGISTEYLLSTIDHQIVLSFLQLDLKEIEKKVRDNLTSVE